MAVKIVNLSLALNDGKEIIQLSAVDLELLREIQHDVASSVLSRCEVVDC